MTSPIPDSEALQAVRDRNVAYDGKFFFAVVTTGIYCRPSCASRPALAENMRFFPSAEKAVSAGFRACKRCKPESLTGPEYSIGNHTVVDVARFIEARADEKITLSMLADEFDVSASHLQKVFSATFGLSPKAFQDGIRQQRFKSILRDGETVTDAVFAAGYGSSSRVYESASRQLGMTPGAYKKGAQGERIHFACGETSLGYLMLAATDKGVCFAMFGRHKNEVKKMLVDEFPQASIEPSPHSSQLDTWFIEIEQHLSTNQTMPDIPLDLRGTAFQMRVWQFLQTIAAGEVVSYKDVAVGIDKPTAIRAAATACAKNRVAVLVPCHRVLRGDGGIGGYRWGVDVKRKLLASEKA